MPAMWRWALRLGGSTDLGTRGQGAPGHAYASSPAPQARALSLLRFASSRAGSALGMCAGFRRDGPDGAARVRESGLGRLGGRGRGGARGELYSTVAG
jgi:hypothetical protein